MLIYLLQRELLIVSKNLLPEKNLNEVLIIVHEAIADTLKDNLYSNAEESYTKH